MNRRHAPPQLGPLADRAAAEFGITVRELRDRDRSAPLARARFAFCWVAWFTLDASVSAIGRWLGRDHSTASHAIARARALRESDPDFRAASDRLRAGVDTARG